MLRLQLITHSINDTVVNTTGGALTATDFTLSIYSGTGTVLATSSSISVIPNVYTLGMTHTSIAGDVIKVSPTAASIFDSAGNVVSATQTNNLGTLN
jgi:hypothetical protein